MVGAAEGPHIHQRVGGVGHTGHGVDLRGLKGFGAGHIGQNGGDAPCQHGLARAGRTDEQHVVAAGGGDLQPALHVFLSHHIGKVRQGTGGGLRLPAGSGRHGRFALQVGDELGHILHAADGEAVGQRGLGGVLRRDVQRLDAQPGGAQRHGQHAGDGAQRPGKAQLTQKGGVLRQGLQLLRRGQNAQQDGQVVQRALLADTGGGQIHGDPADGEFGAAVFHGGADTLPRFLDGGIRQTHHIKGGQSAGEKTLHRHLVAADAGESQRTHGDHHGPSSPFQYVVRPSSYHKNWWVNSAFFKKATGVLRGTTLSDGHGMRKFVHGAKKVSQ